MYVCIFVRTTKRDTLYLLLYSTRWIFFDYLFFSPNYLLFSTDYPTSFYSIHCPIGFLSSHKPTFFCVVTVVVVVVSHIQRIGCQPEKTT